MHRRFFALIGAISLCCLSIPVEAQTASSTTGCGRLPGAGKLRNLLIQAAVPNNPDLTPALTAGGQGPGGLFGGARMWAAVVNRQGELCAWNTSTAARAQVWPGSQAIAKAKAYTANAFSLDLTEGGFPLSTAQLYTFTQPGHSLWGLNQSNLFNSHFLAVPQETDLGLGRVAGGIITFGGGVALYDGTEIIGGLGISGDTACTDHEIAKFVRDLAGLNPGGNPLADDISYSSADGASPFTHPLCPNTVRNGVSLGNELNAVGY